MSHLYFCYIGNKRNEYKFIEDKFNFDGIENIIEPFCGSAAISFNIWLKHKDRFNYYINDNAKDLI
jgi:site-specific DNA-adenine methylase